MKTIAFPALLAAVAMLAACDPQVETTPQAALNDPAAHAGEIAGDKAMMADVMQRSFQKGTFDDALALAIEDSALAAEVVGVIRANPRYAALFGPAPTAEPQKAASTAARTSTSRSTTSARTTTASKDPLDKAEQTMQKTNDKLEQAERVRQQMEEARRKAEGILRPR